MSRGGTKKYNKSKQKKYMRFLQTLGDKACFPSVVSFYYIHFHISCDTFPSKENHKIVILNKRKVVIVVVYLD